MKEDIEYMMKEQDTVKNDQADRKTKEKFSN